MLKELGMPTVDERMAHVEGRMTEQSQMFVDIREEMRGIRGEILGIRGELREEIAGVRGELREGFRRVDHKFEAMEARMSRDFRWLVGIQITTLVAIIVALISRG